MFRTAATTLQSGVSVDITIQVPEDLGRRLERYRERLP